MRVQGRVSAAPASSCMACCLAGWCGVTSGGDGGWESGPMGKQTRSSEGK